MKNGIRAGVLLCASAVLAAFSGMARADNADWVNRIVRVNFGAEQSAAVNGKVTRFDRCLYVKLDTPRDGIALVRMDQITRLQVRSGSTWVASDLQALLRREPVHCFDEANG